MDVEIITALLNLGGQGVLIYFIGQLWSEQKANNQYLRDQARRQEEADDERAELRQKMQALEGRKPKTEPRKPGGSFFDN